MKLRSIGICEKTKMEVGFGVDWILRTKQKTRRTQRSDELSYFSQLGPFVPVGSSATPMVYLIHLQCLQNKNETDWQQEDAALSSESGLDCKIGLSVGRLLMGAEIGRIAILRTTIGSEHLSLSVYSNGHTHWLTDRLMITNLVVREAPGLSGCPKKN